MYLAIFLYLLAIGLQLFAASYAAILFFKSTEFRRSSVLLALGLILMTERRAEPLYEIYQSGEYSIEEAIFSLVISALFLIALKQIRKLIMQLEEKNFFLDRTAKVDSLTQAISRSETFARSELEIERALRNKQPIAFLMLDIDHFKKINDNYGHPVGDIVLQCLVKHCQEELRAIDIFGRVGGEEFFIALPETSEALAYEVAERVRKRIAAKPSAIVNGEEIHITVSIGVAVFDPSCHGETEANIILRARYKNADEAMYFAKQSGRNRSQIWTHKMKSESH